MMNQQKRITAMDSLKEYLDRMVTVDFIYYANENWQRTGKLIEYEPFSHIIVDPYEYLKSVGLVKGENRFLEEREGRRPFRIDFVKESSGIISIRELINNEEYKTIYDNRWIIPRFNPAYHNTRGELVEKGAIKKKENAEDITNHVRKLTFGSEYSRGI